MNFPIAGHNERFSEQGPIIRVSQQITFENLVKKWRMLRSLFTFTLMFSRLHISTEFSVFIFCCRRRSALWKFVWFQGVENELRIDSLLNVLLFVKSVLFNVCFHIFP